MDHAAGPALRSTDLAHGSGHLSQWQTVVLDIGGMKAADRGRMLGQASDAGLVSRAYFLDADPLTRRRRVEERNVSRGPSFAFVVTPAMFEAMQHSTSRRIVTS